MPAQVVITRQYANTPAIGGLFSGLSFFLLQRLPMRSTFIERIQANGGRVVKLENQADYIIADHKRPDCPPGSISFTFIDEAIREGALPNPQDHATRVPKGVAREAGSGVPGKSTRTPFTAEDDRVLWNWVKRSGGAVKGNEIYKQLEAENSRHTWQAWRDRYVKRLAIRPPEGVEVTVPANAPPSPPTAQDEQQEIQAQVDGVAEDAEAVQEEAEAEEDEFGEDDLNLLLNQADDIEDMDESKEEAAWSAFAQVYDNHTKDVWQQFWREVVRPIYLKRKAAEQQAQEDEWKAATAKDENRPRPVEVEGADQRTPSEEDSDPAAAAAVPSSSQKRKRPAFDSPAGRRLRKKELKSENDKMPTKPNKEHETTFPVSHQALPTSEVNQQPQRQLRQESGVSSELNRQAHKQLRQESGVSSESALPELPVRETTEDPQAEAQAQFDEEVLGIARQPESAAALGMSNLPTSDINNAADRQLTQESLERGDEVDDEQDESSELKSVSVSSGDDEEDAKSTYSQEDEEAPESQIETPSAPLTEANLASQQAQQQSPLLRGADLPEDNDVQDGERQDEFVRYLQGVTAKSGGGEVMPAITYDSQAPIALESQLPQEALLSYDALDSANIDELPIASQREIDEAMDGLIQWPSSPEISQRKEVPESQSQSLQMETQIPYPSLPAQSQRIPPLEQEAMFSSQPSMGLGVSYPSLPRQGEGSLLQPQPDSQRARDEDEGSLVTSEESISSQQDVDEQDEAEVDFSIPTPVGGWSSSPAKAQSSQATPIASQRQVRIKQESRVPEDSPPRSQIAPAQEIVEVSSTSSSSSSSSEEEEAAPSTPTAPVRRRALETQDILDAETQVPDFDLPLPPVSPNPSSSVSNPSSSPLPNASASQPALADTQRLEDGDVNTYITRMTVIEGFKEEDIISALKCTSMRGELAEHVLRSERAGLGFPVAPGIWSEEEDRVLESGNAQALRKLEEKHTWAEMEERLQFLEDWREDEEE